MQKELSVIIPVYNEQEIITTVIDDWWSTLTDLGITFDIHIYNDGSRDDSLAECRKASLNYGNVIVHDKPNSGHGPTILRGYRESCPLYDWIFQVDSDNEMPSFFFNSLWQNRGNYDILLGTRAQRKQDFGRHLISKISRITIHTLYGRSIFDVNSPYRLFKTSKFRTVLQAIPSDTFAPNLILTGFACLKKMDSLEIPVNHCCRTTGEFSLRSIRLFKSACKALLQTIAFRMIQIPTLTDQ